MVLLLSILLSASSANSEQPSATCPIPLIKGSVWVYEGDVEYMVEGATEATKKHLRFEMSVEDVFEKGKYNFAVVRGFPANIRWNSDDQEKEQKSSLLVWDATSVVEISFESQQDLEADLDYRVSDINSTEEPIGGFIELPLTEGKNYGGDPEREEDGMYCWHVDEVKSVTPEVKGYKGKGMVNRYTIMFRSMPDHVIYEVTEGLGITRYEYGHHGTPASASFKLVEYRKSVAVEQ